MVLHNVCCALTASILIQICTTYIVYRIRGEFPRVRYFSIQTYTIQRQVRVDDYHLEQSRVN